MIAPMSDERLAACCDLPQLIRRHTWTAAEDAADAIRDLTAEVKRLRAQLAEIGETREEFGVRTYDEDKYVEVMSSREQARDLAEAWRHEIPDSSPRVMVRTRQSKPGEWREVPDA